MQDLDVSFDFRSDASGKDPDISSKTLRRYHALLWSKTLPSGASLYVAEDQIHYLIAESPRGLIRLTSDTISNSLSSHKRMRALVGTVDNGLIEEVKRFGATIGARTVFQGDQAGGKTLNVLRGFHPLIRDRFDLTLECIRRHYLGEPSPLSQVLERNTKFFQMFTDFEGFADFFFFSDLIEAGRIQYFFGQAEAFGRSPYPENKYEYEAYLASTLEFLANRTARIAHWLGANSASSK